MMPITVLNSIIIAVEYGNVGTTAASGKAHR
jgi:hypothetical protein